MRVQVNGEIRELAESLTLGDLVGQLSLAPERLAIELNREVVRRARWAETILHEGDQVEIVHFVGGGSDDAPAEMMPGSLPALRTFNRTRRIMTLAIAFKKKKKTGLTG